MQEAAPSFYATASRILLLDVKNLAHLHVNSVSVLKEALVSLANTPTAKTVLECGTRPTPSSSPFGQGLGLETTLHLVPFQCSISVCPASGDALLLEDPPTAHTSFAERAVTPLHDPL
jgi:hypothetical protein